MIEQSLDAALNSVINVVFGGVITLLITMYRQKKKENDALKAGLQALLRDRIIQAYNHYVQDKGWIPIYAKESIDACYKSYEALGDNGVIDNLMEQINELQNYPPRIEVMKMRKLLNVLKKDDNAYSVGRICAVIGFIVWVLVTLWLAFFAKTWSSYESCTLGMVTLLLVQLGNKAIETRMFKVKSEERNDE